MRGCVLALILQKRPLSDWHDFLSEIRSETSKRLGKNETRQTQRRWRRLGNCMVQIYLAIMKTFLVSNDDNILTKNEINIMNIVTGLLDKPLRLALVDTYNDCCPRFLAEV